MTSASSRRIEKSEDAYRSIGEAADELDLQPHVLRYWEAKFRKFVRPLKRRDGRRMFRPDDMQALRAIQLLVHQRGMTLKGAARLLEEQGVEVVLSGTAKLVGAMSVDSQTAEAAQGPARDLQETVRKAFSAKFPETTAQGTEERLMQALEDLNDIKLRLDAALSRHAA